MLYRSGFLHTFRPSTLIVTGARQLGSPSAAPVRKLEEEPSKQQSQQQKSPQVATAPRTAAAAQGLSVTWSLKDGGIAVVKIDCPGDKAKCCARARPDPIGPGLTDPVTGTHRYLEEVAVQASTQLADGTLKGGARAKPFMSQLVNLLLTHRPLLDAVLLHKAKEGVMKQTHGNYPAPAKLLDVIRTGLVDGDHEGYEAETKTFGELSQTKECAALIGLYWGRNACQKDKYREARKCERLGVIGAGLMGASIANINNVSIRHISHYQSSSVVPPPIPHHADSWDFVKAHIGKKVGDKTNTLLVFFFGIFATMFFGFFYFIKKEMREDTKRIESSLHEDILRMQSHLSGIRQQEMALELVRLVLTDETDGKKK